MKDIEKIDVKKVTKGSLRGTLVLHDCNIKKISWEEASGKEATTATVPVIGFADLGDNKELRFAFKVLVDACPEVERVACFDNLTMKRTPLENGDCVYEMNV